MPSFATRALSPNQAGNANIYAAAPQVTDSFTITKVAQAITNLNPAATVAFQVGNTLTLSATGTPTNNPVIFASTTTATCTTSGTNGTILTAVAVTSNTNPCTITANQTGDLNIYTAATQLTRNYTIVAAGALSPQAITGFTSTPLSTAANPISYTGTGVGGATSTTPNLTVSATPGASGNSVIFTTTSPMVCAISTTPPANVVTIITAGTCVVRANQAANASYAAAPQVTLNIVIAKATQTITNFAPPASITQTVGSTITARLLKMICNPRPSR